jgi:hypothetical protein
MPNKVWEKIDGYTNLSHAKVSTNKKLYSINYIFDKQYVEI